MDMTKNGYIRLHLVHREQNYEADFRQLILKSQCHLVIRNVKYQIKMLYLIFNQNLQQCFCMVHEIQWLSILYHHLSPSGV